MANDKDDAMHDDPNSDSLIADPDAPPTPEELAAAARLRDGLDGPSNIRDPAADFAKSLGVAYRGGDIAKEENAELVRRQIPLRKPARVFVVGSLALAAAAAVVLSLGGGWNRESAPTSSSPPLILPHSTQALFSDPFEAAGGQTSRIDRIASSRVSALRENRFRQWGVR